MSRSVNVFFVWKNCQNMSRRGVRVCVFGVCAKSAQQGRTNRQHGVFGGPFGVRFCFFWLVQQKVNRAGEIHNAACFSAAFLCTLLPVCCAAKVHSRRGEVNNMICWAAGRCTFSCFLILQKKRTMRTQHGTVGGQTTRKRRNKQGIDRTTWYRCAQVQTRRIPLVSQPRRKRSKKGQNQSCFQWWRHVLPRWISQRWKAHLAVWGKLVVRPQKDWHCFQAM